MCPTCKNLKIKEIIIEDINDNLITLKSDDYDIGLYMSKMKIGNYDLLNIPWTLKYEIILTGKFDREKVNSFDFASPEMMDELKNQRNNDIFKEGLCNLKNIFWSNINPKYLNFKYKSNIKVILTNNNEYIIESELEHVEYPEIPKFKFEREENNPIK